MLQGVKESLAKLPREAKASAIYKRLTSDVQRHFYFVHLAKVTPIEESNVARDFDIPGVEELYKKPWAKWLDLEAPYCEEVVKEFLTTMERKFEVDEEGCEVDVGVEAWVKGVKVMITIEGFNKYFECEEAQPEHIVEIDGVEDLIVNDPNYQEKINEALFKPTFTMSSPKAYEKLSTKAKVINKVLFNRVHSRKNPRKVVKEKLALVYAVMKGDVMINLGYQVVKNLVAMCEAKGRLASLPYPRLITLFCMRAKVKMVTTSPNWTFSRNQYLRTRGFDAPKRVPNTRKRSRDLTQDTESAEASDKAKSESSVASTQQESWSRLEAYFERQEAFIGRMDEFMRAQAKLMEKYEETLKMSRGTEEPSVVETREEGEFDDGA